MRRARDPKPDGIMRSTRGKPSTSTPPFVATHWDPENAGRPAILAWRIYATSGAPKGVSSVTSPPQLFTHMAQELPDASDMTPVVTKSETGPELDRRELEPPLEKHHPAGPTDLGVVEAPRATRNLVERRINAEGGSVRTV